VKCIISNKYIIRTSHLYCDINEIDPGGNTPIMLAIKTNNLDALNVLCDHEADIKHKCFEGDISPLEFAVKTKNKKALKILVNAMKKQKLSHWENHKNDVLELIKRIPDFSLDLKLNFDSNIFYLFSSITPCDYYKISKLGGNVRIDMNISSMNSSLKSIKGKCSILIEEKGNKISIFKIDHEKKKSYDYISSLMHINDEDKKVNELIEEGLQNSKIFTKNITLTENSSNNKKKNEENILNFNCKKYNANGMLYVVKEKIKPKKSNDLSNREDEIKGISFSDYFKMCLKEKEKNRDLINPQILKKRKSEEKIKKKMASTSKINEGSKLNQQKEYLRTETNKNTINDQSDSEYEVEHFEKLKKTENMKIHKKPINMSIWISDQFPIKISHFIPLIHILSFTSSEFSHLKSTLCSNFLPFQSFPMKISFPLGLSFHALLTVTGFSSSPPPISTFDLNYQSPEESISNRRESIQATLDDNYAKDFYEQYYLEKKNKKNTHKRTSKNRMVTEDSDMDQSSSSFERIKEIFQNNMEDDTYVNYSNTLNNIAPEIKIEPLTSRTNNNVTESCNKLIEINFNDKLDTSENGCLTKREIMSNGGIYENRIENENEERQLDLTQGEFNSEENVTLPEQKNIKILNQALEELNKNKMIKLPPRIPKYKNKKLSLNKKYLEGDKFNPIIEISKLNEEITQNSQIRSSSFHSPSSYYTNAKSYIQLNVNSKEDLCNYQFTYLDPGKLELRSLNELVESSHPINFLEQMENDEIPSEKISLKMKQQRLKIPMTPVTPRRRIDHKHKSTSYKNKLPPIKDKPEDLDESQDTLRYDIQLAKNSYNDYFQSKTNIECKFSNKSDNDKKDNISCNINIKKESFFEKLFGFFKSK
jgi:hypothetical protein